MVNISPRLIVMLLILLSVFSLPLPGEATPPAQSNEIINYGESVTRRIAANASQRFQFEGQAGDVVDIRVQGDLFNTLTLYTPDDIALATSRNLALNEPASRIGYFVLPSANTYTIEITNVGQGDEQYTLSLNGGAYAVIPIQFGDTATNTLSDPHVDIWTFSASAGDTVSLVIQSDFDSFVELFAPGSQLSGTTRSNSAGSAEILNLSLDATGSYHLAVSYFGAAGGDYSVQLDGVSANFWVLEHGIEAEARFVTADPHQWTFQGVAGEFVTIGVISRLDTFMALYVGEQLIASDDDLFRHNPYLRDVELPASGTYTLYVWDYTYTGGTYKIFFNKSLTASENGSNHLTFGDAFYDEFEGDQVTWTFDGTRGDVISIGTHLSFIGALNLYNPAGELLARSFTTTPAHPNVLDLRLPTTGTYRIVLEQDYATSNTYRIGLLGRTEEIASVAYGDEILLMATVSEREQTFVLNAEAGDVVNMNLGPAFDLHITVYDEAGDYVIGDSVDFVRDAMVREWVVPASGQYTVVVAYPYFDPEPNQSGTDDDINQYKFTVDEVFLSATPLSYGDELEVEIIEDPDNPFGEEAHYYKFTAQNEDVVQVTVNDMYDADVTIYDSNFEEIDTLPVFQEFTDQTFEFQTRSNGTYIIAVYDEYGISSAYTIGLEQRSRPSYQPPPSSTPEALTALRVGDTATGNLGDNFQGGWDFHADVGEPVFIGFSADNFVPIVNIANLPGVATLDATSISGIGGYVTAYVNLNGFVEARINVHDADTGVYTITVRGTALGDDSYEIVVKPMSEVALFLPDDNPVAFEPGNGSRIDHLYYFAATAQDDVHIIFDADEAVNYQLIGPYADVQRRLDGNDISVPVLADGTYAIWIPKPPDSYSIQVIAQRLDTGVIIPDTTTEATPSQLPTTVPGEDPTRRANTLSPSGRDSWEITGQAGDILTAEITSDFDSYIELFSPTGQLLAFNDDTNGLDAAIVDYELPSSGTYTVVVSGIGNSAGDYELEINIE